MKAKPTNRPGEIVLEINHRDEALIESAERQARPSPFRLKRILVPTDFSNCARKALRYALALAKEHRAAITLLYVVEPPPYMTGEFAAFDYTAIEGEIRSDSQKELAALVANEVRNTVPANSLVCSGAAAVEIIETAKRLPADLIVISTHGRTGLKHVFLGSVTEHVVRRAPCPVLVVREQEQEFIAPGE